MAQCKTMISRNGRSFRCQNFAGRTGPYCGIHDPVRKVARKAERQRKAALEAQQARDLAEVPAMRKLIEVACMFASGEVYLHELVNAVATYDAEVERLAEEAS